jgi:hypothetical protein
VPVPPGGRTRLVFAVAADSTAQPVPAGTVVDVRLEVSDGTRVRSLAATGR